jgi:hypothetical protein
LEVPVAPNAHQKYEQRSVNAPLMFEQVQEVWGPDWGRQLHAGGEQPGVTQDQFSPAEEMKSEQ